jgi:hypothetical protein
MVSVAAIDKHRRILIGVSTLTDSGLYRKIAGQPTPTANRDF